MEQMSDQQRMEFFCNAHQEGLTNGQLKTAVVSLLKEKRVAHVLGCAETAVHLARLWGADPDDAYRAGLLHDVTKALDGKNQQDLCAALGVQVDEFLWNNPKTLHQITGAAVADRVFGENQNVCDAIRSHTTGCAGMNTLQKIIYIADYMEPNRSFEGVEELRRLAVTDLDAALKMGLTMSVSLLKEQGREVCPDSMAALDELEKEKTVC